MKGAFQICFGDQAPFKMPFKPSRNQAERDFVSAQHKNSLPTLLVKSTLFEPSSSLLRQEKILLVYPAPNAYMVRNVRVLRKV